MPVPVPVRAPVRALAQAPVRAMAKSLVLVLALVPMKGSVQLPRLVPERVLRMGLAH